jgi:hypothetical protein
MESINAQIMLISICKRKQLTSLLNRTQQMLTPVDSSSLTVNLKITGYLGAITGLVGKLLELF